MVLLPYYQRINPLLLLVLFLHLMTKCINHQWVSQTASVCVLIFWKSSAITIAQPTVPPHGEPSPTQYLQAMAEIISGNNYNDNYCSNTTNCKWLLLVVSSPCSCSWGKGVLSADVEVCVKYTQPILLSSQNCAPCFSYSPGGCHCYCHPALWLLTPSEVLNLCKQLHVASAWF